MSAPALVYVRRRPCGCLTGEATTDTLTVSRFLKHGHAIQAPPDPSGLPSRCERCDPTPIETQGAHPMTAGAARTHAAAAQGVPS